MTVKERLIKIATRPRPGVRVTRKQIGELLESHKIAVAYNIMHCDNGLRAWTEIDVVTAYGTIYSSDNAMVAAATALEWIEYSH